MNCAEIKINDRFYSMCSYENFFPTPKAEKKFIKFIVSHPEDLKGTSFKCYNGPKKVLPVLCGRSTSLYLNSRLCSVNLKSLAKRILRENELKNSDFSSCKKYANALQKIYIERKKDGYDKVALKSVIRRLKICSKTQQLVVLP